MELAPDELITLRVALAARLKELDKIKGLTREERFNERVRVIVLGERYGIEVY